MAKRMYDFICMECGVVKSYPLDPVDVERWRKGELIQEIFPEIEDREIMISSLCSRCFDAMFEGVEP